MYYYSPFYVVFAIFRLLVNLTLLIKFKFDFRQTIVALWIVMALWTFFLDAMFISILATRKLSFDEQPTEMIGLLVDETLTIQKWIVMTMTWLTLDHTIRLSQVIKCAYNYCSPCLAFSLAILAVTAYRSEKVQPIALIDDDTLTVSMCTGATIGFLIMAWKSEAGEQPSFLIFGCIFTQLPLSSLFKALVMSSFTKYSLFAIPIAHKLQYIVLYGIVQVEAISAARVIVDTYRKKFTWPEIKEYGIQSAAQIQP